MKKFISLFLFLFPLLLLAQDLKFEKITQDQKLSHNTVRSILQDSKGFIWFGTEDGLNLYDGYHFRVFRNLASDPNSISDNFIRAIIEDRAGTIWVATNDGGVNKFDRKTERFIHYSANGGEWGISSTSIRHVCEGSDGNIWIATLDRGLNCLNTKTGKITSNFSKFLSSLELRYCFNDQLGRLLVGTSQGLDVIDLKTKKSKSWFKGMTLQSKEVNCITQDKKHHYWVGTSKGLLVFGINGEIIKQYFHDSKKQNSLTDNEITSIYIDKFGKIWIGTGKGLNIYRPQSDDFENILHNDYEPASISRNNILSIIEDKTGIIWIGTAEGGINKFDIQKNRFGFYHNNPQIAQSLSFNTVRIMFEDRKKRFWLGTLGEGLELFDQHTNQFKHFKHDPSNANSISHNKISAITDDSEGFLWVGTWEGGLNKMVKPNQFVKYTHQETDRNSICSNIIQVIYEDRKKRLWVGTNSGLDLFDRKNNQFKHIPHSTVTGLSGPMVQSKALVEDKDGNIWVGTWNGLNKLDKNETRDPEHYQFQHFRHDRKRPHSLSDDRIISLYVDKAGTLWIGTYGGGLNKLMPNKGQNLGTYDAEFKSYSTKDGLVNDVIYGILEDDAGNLWLSTNDGISKFNIKTEKFRNLDFYDGLQGNQFFWGASCSLHDGSLAFGGINGVNIFKPNLVQDNPFEPDVVITDFKLFNESVAPGKDSPLQHAIGEETEIRLKPNQNSITIEFAGLHFSVPEKNRYQYKLQGFDKNWIETDSRRRYATYTNLDPKTYIFRVKAANCDGKWSKIERTIKIKVLPPFWKTWWFKLLSAAVILILGVIVFQIRFYRIRKQNKRLELEVRRRTNEITRQKEKIENAYEIIEQKNNHIEGGIRYAQNIQNAILPQDHLIASIFDYFIIFMPKDVVSGDFYWMLRKQISDAKTSVFVATVDCTGHGVPGAFMSLIGYSLLNEIVNEKQIYAPSRILDELNIGIRKALHQDTTANNDGMDISLCRLDLQNTGGKCELYFSGAKRNGFVYHAAKDTIEILEADRIMIGGARASNINTKFTEKRLTIQAGDIIYLMSDGLIDQNGPDRRRLGSDALFELIDSIKKQPMEAQKLKIASFFEEFKAGEIQRDDITLWGLKLKNSKTS